MDAVGASPIVRMPPADPTKEIAGTRSEHRVKMNRMRQKIAQRLKDAQNTNAMLTTFNELDMSALMQLRKENQDAFVKRHGIKLGFMSAFVKASAYALTQQPTVNAVIDGQEIVYRDYVDISVAVATPKVFSEISNLLPFSRVISLTAIFSRPKELKNINFSSRTMGTMQCILQGFLLRLIYVFK